MVTREEVLKVLTPYMTQSNIDHITDSYIMITADEGPFVKFLEETCLEQSQTYEDFEHIYEYAGFTVEWDEDIWSDYI